MWTLWRRKWFGNFRTRNTSVIHFKYEVVLMDVAQRIQIASSFLSQSPPGEINDVLNGMIINHLCKSRFSALKDVRNIIADDDLLQDGIQPAVREYNLEQFTVVDVPDTTHQVRWSIYWDFVH